MVWVAPGLTMYWTSGCTVSRIHLNLVRPLKNHFVSVLRLIQRCLLGGKVAAVATIGHAKIGNPIPIRIKPTY
jgi:hypothetical protein